MFAQLLIEVDPWPSHHRGGKIPHSVCLTLKMCLFGDLLLNSTEEYES